MVQIPETGRQALDADLMREWAARGIDTLTRHRRGVDELNVYPVADSDTATNMVATLQAAFQGGTPGLGLEALLDEAAGRALLSARGNSGVILAQMLRGLADVWNADTVDAKGFAAGLRSATDAATGAVAVPQAGTILTVAESAASAAAKAAPFGLVSASRAAAEAAAEAVAATPGQLPALARAGVVDAGGLALALLLEALVETLTGSRPTGALDLLERHRVRAVEETEQVPRETGSEVYGYEVQYLLEANAGAASELRHRLTDLGDSVVIIGSRAARDVTTFNVHVHVNDIGAAIEAGIERGRVHRISVTRFDDTALDGTLAHADARMHAAPARRPAHATEPARALIVVTEAAGLREFLAGEGCRTATGATVGAELAAALADGADSAVVISDTEAASRTADRAVEAARADGHRAAAIFAVTPVQAVAAVAIHDPEREFDDDVAAMAETIRACRTGEVRTAPDGFTANVQGQAPAAFADAAGAARDLADRLCAEGAELLTVLPGAGSDPETVTALSHHVREAWPTVEIQQLPAADTEPLLLIGAE
ncbi:DAK2 domain-containing protein [Glycomyces sp. NPDC047010]|uniref:DAK2 domain-containing protein n=1 Tax=Glycomyces sp. NPDC047010 TaxID=3155023 RepID=UPI00340BE467